MPPRTCGHHGGAVGGSVADTPPPERPGAATRATRPGHPRGGVAAGERSGDAGRCVVAAPTPRPAGGAGPRTATWVRAARARPALSATARGAVAPHDAGGPDRTGAGDRAPPRPARTPDLRVPPEMEGSP